jgi:hypothetical protein
MDSGMQQIDEITRARLRPEPPRRSRPGRGRPDDVSPEMMILGMALGILMLALAVSLT